MRFQVFPIRSYSRLRPGVLAATSHPKAALLCCPSGDDDVEWLPDTMHAETAYPWAQTSRNTTALLCASSLAPNSKVTCLWLASNERSSSSVGFRLNSAL